MSKRILVTGGAGYIGSILVPALLADGHQVTVVDNFLFRQQSLSAVCADQNFDLIAGDVRDERVVTPLYAKSDVIIPLAALVGAPLSAKDPWAAVAINRDAIGTLVREVSATQQILMPVTNSGYGIGEQGKFCTEDSPLRPISLYGIHKVEAERMVLERENSISFRLATVFGMSPRMRLDLLVNDFVYRAVNDRFIVLFEAHFKRNYIHVRDVAQAFRHGLTNFDAMRGRPYNVGLSDANFSKAELCAVIQKQLPNFVFMEAPIGEDPDKRDYLVSNARIEATGYRPQFSLDDGVGELIKGYRMLRRTEFANS